MIDVKNEMRYILVTRLLEQAAEAGLLSAEELWAAKGKRYSKDVLAALPEMPVTGSLKDVAKFIQSVKGPDYFREASA